MYIKFKSDHTSGILKGTVSDYDTATGSRLVAEGIAVESNKAEFEAYKIEARKKAELEAEAYGKKCIADNKARIEREKAEANKPKPLSDSEKIKSLEESIYLQGGQLSEKDAEITALKIQIEKLTKK